MGAALWARRHGARHARAEEAETRSPPTEARRAPDADPAACREWLAQRHASLQAAFESLVLWQPSPIHDERERIMHAAVFQGLWAGEFAGNDAARFPYVVEHEWDLRAVNGEAGFGDFVLCNERMECLVLEVKYIDARKPLSARARRRAVHKQASRYGRAFRLAARCYGPRSEFCVRRVWWDVFTPESAAQLELLAVRPRAHMAPGQQRAP
jgi:hypothetical protein